MSKCSSKLVRQLGFQETGEDDRIKNPSYKDRQSLPEYQLFHNR
jgi:hypothetical protein